LLGGAGADTITAGLGADTVLGGAGDDVLRGGIIDSLSGFLEGGAGTNYTDDRADLMLGGAGNDLLDGANGSDTLFGGRGDDTLIGARGTDLLVGGRGHDVFLFAPEAGIFGGPDTGIGPEMRDVILDFYQGQDLIDLSRLAFRFGSPADGTEPLPVFLGEGEFEASLALQVRVVTEGAVTIVQFASGLRSTDPDAAPEPPTGPSGEIELLGPYHLSEADFILV
jgi:Ca2+-binding RTX toxin-like protein